MKITQLPYCLILNDKGHEYTDKTCATEHERIVLSGFHKFMYHTLHTLTLFNAEDMGYFAGRSSDHCNSQQLTTASNLSDHYHHVKKTLSQFPWCLWIELLQYFCSLCSHCFCCEMFFHTCTYDSSAFRYTAPVPSQSRKMLSKHFFSQTSLQFPKH